MTDWIKGIVEFLGRSREFYAAHGHDVSRISIGHFDGTVRVCDDTGAYDVWNGQAGAICQTSYGRPSGTLRSIFYHQEAAS